MQFPSPGPVERIRMFEIYKIFEFGQIEPVRIELNAILDLTLKFDKLSLKRGEVIVGMTQPDPDIMYEFRPCGGKRADPTRMTEEEEYKAKEGP